MIRRIENIHVARSFSTLIFKLQGPKEEIAEARRYYDRISDSGDRDLQTDGGLHGFLRRLEKIQEGVEGGRVLEVGAGAGRFSIALRERHLDIVATDISPGMLRRLSQHGLDIPTIVSDAHHLPFRNGVFDSVFSSDVLEHLPKPEVAIEEQVRVCKNMGIVQAVVPNRHCPYYLRNKLRERYWWRYGTSPIHHRRSAKELASLFKKQGLTLNRLDTFLLVPARARGRIFLAFLGIEKFAERNLLTRLFLGLNYVRARTP